MKASGEREACERRATANAAGRPPVRIFLSVATRIESCADGRISATRKVQASAERPPQAHICWQRGFSPCAFARKRLAGIAALEGAFSFREMSHFNALQRLFLPTSGVRRLGASRRGDHPSGQSARTIVATLFRFDKVGVRLRRDLTIIPMIRQMGSVLLSNFTQPPACRPNRRAIENG